VKLTGAAVLEPLLTDYAAALHRKEKATDLGRRLYDTILLPVNEIKARPHLLIARHGALHMVPFEAFISPSGRYAVLQHTITYTPSGPRWPCCANRRTAPRR
jgi:hypothetical protein